MVLKIKYGSWNIPHKKHGCLPINYAQQSLNCKVDAIEQSKVKRYNFCRLYIIFKTYVMCFTGKLNVH